MSGTPTFFSKKNSRKISSFIGIELLYDYLAKNLDPERSKAMDELIAQSREMNDEIKSIQRSLSYLDHLSGTQISVTLANRIKAPTSYYQGFLKKVKFSDWPVGIKLGIEALFVSTLIFSSIIMIPWHRINNMNFTSSRETLLVELEREKPKIAGSEAEISPKSVAPESVNAAVTFQDEGASAKGSNADKGSPLETKPTAPEIKVENSKVEVAKSVFPSAKEVVAKSTPTPQSSAKTSAENAESKAEAKNETKSEAKTGTGQGFLYRGSISVSNLPVTSQKFVDKIASLGGRRAGEVELGWKKGGGNYFHFTIPEAKYETLTSYLGEYGKLKIQRERHERVLPDGIIRLIITVSEEKKRP